MNIWFAGGGTGGHLYPALAIARALVARDPEVKPYFIGAQRGIERDVLPQAEFPFTLLDLHPLYRSRPWENWKTVRGLLSAWGSLGTLTREYPPAAVIATGGYASGAALAHAWLHHAPMFLQEANSHPGATVRLFSRFAREVYMGFPEAAGMLKRGALTQLVDSGCPIDPPPSPRPSRSSTRAKWGFPAEGGRVLLIFGGSQGARALNDVVDAWVAHGIPDDLFVIWGTGKRDFERYAAREQPRVRVRAYLAPITDAYAAADLALTRAGAMTTSELCAWGIPSLLVPLPTAAADHQTANARALEAAGAARHLPQAELTAETLDDAVRALLADPARMASLAQGALSRARPDASVQIADRILTVLRAARDTSTRT